MVVNDEAQDEFDVKKPEGDGTLWAFALANLFSIMLAFFVMLYAFSNPNFDKVKATVDGVKDKFSEQTLGKLKQGIVLDVPSEGIEVPLKQYFAETKQYMMQELQIDEASVIEKGNVLLFRLPAEMLFVHGTAEMDDKKLFLKRMADGLTNHPIGQQLDIAFMIGRDQAQAKDKLPLSVLRAGAFSRRMVALGVPEDTVYTGISDGDPKFFTIKFYPREETRSKLEF